MEADQTLERCTLVGDRVVEAVDEQVRTVVEVARAAEMIGGVRPEHDERIRALDAVVGQPVDAVGAQHDVADDLVAHEHASDSRVGPEPLDQPGVERVDLLARRPTVDPGERDQPEVARGEHDDVLLVDATGPFGGGPDDDLAVDGPAAGRPPDHLADP